MSLTKQGAAHVAASKLTQTHLDAVADQYVAWIDGKASEVAAIDALMTAADLSKHPDRVLALADGLYAEMDDYSPSSGLPDYLQQASLTAAYTGQAITLSDVPEPWTMYHRGIHNMVPQNSMESFRAALTAGAQVIETDFYLTKDGSLVCLHDKTLDQITTYTGNTEDLSAATIQLVKNDYGNWVGGAWAGTQLRVLTFEDVIEEFGGRVILVCEGKNVGATDAIVERLNARPWLRDSVIVATFHAYKDELGRAKDAGYVTALYDWNAGSLMATLASYGHDYIGLSGDAVSEQHVDDLAGLGVKTWISIAKANRFYAEKWLNRQPTVTGIISDDGLYTSGTNRHRLTVDPFKDGTWYHGHLNSVGQRGVFLSGGRWGYTANKSSNLIGALCPIATPDSFTMTFTLHIDQLDTNANQWCGIFIATNDSPLDPYAFTADNSGYHLLMRQNGTLQIYNYDAGSTSPPAATTLAALTVGSYTFTLTVTPTDITLSRDGVGSVSLADASKRGEFLHFTYVPSSGLQVSWSDITIT